jgi:chloride channel protein, CIC family
MAGGAVGMLVHRIAPFPTADPGAYALVGMGTLFAGIVRAPMTSVFMIFEITQDYQILVPLMVANMLSFAISKRYQPLPVYHALLQQDGVHLPSAATQALTPARTARQVMQTDISLIPSDASVEQAWQMAIERPAPAYLVGTRDRLLGPVSHHQLEESMKSGGAEDVIASIVDQSFVHAHVDHPIDMVLDRFAQSGGILPVVSRADAHRVEGVVTIDSILKLAERQARAQASPPLTVAAGAADQGGRSII